MDYEKKYKEALERARALRNEAIEEEYADDYIKDYETIFPELRGSEDERIRKEIIHYLLHTAGGLSSAEQNRWIAYLKKQKEQKPAEWSEEDKKMLERIIERGQSQTQLFGTGLTPEQVSWLKSLRPSWKPSEEQMDAIDRCVDYLAESDNEDAEIMESLQEQLKKL